MIIPGCRLWASGTLPALLPYLHRLGVDLTPTGATVLPRNRTPKAPEANLMHIAEAVRVALQSLWANKLLSVLTFVSGINRYIAEKVFNLGADVLYSFHSSSPSLPPRSTPWALPACWR